MKRWHWYTWLNAVVGENIIDAIVAKKAKWIVVGDATLNTYNGRNNTMIDYPKKVAE